VASFAMRRARPSALPVWDPNMISRGTDGFSATGSPWDANEIREKYPARYPFNHIRWSTENGALSGKTGIVVRSCFMIPVGDSDDWSGRHDQLKTISQGMPATIDIPKPKEAPFHSLDFPFHVSCCRELLRMIFQEIDDVGMRLEV